RCRVHRAVFVVVSKDPTPAEIYTLSLHDALPISQGVQQDGLSGAGFTTDHGHAALERQVDVLGNGEITNGKLEKHRVVPWEIYVLIYSIFRCRYKIHFDRLKPCLTSPI